MIFSILLAIVAGVAPAIPAYFITQKIILNSKPVQLKKLPSRITPVLEQYQERQREIEGRVNSPALPQSSGSARAMTPAETNYARWVKNQVELPLVRRSIEALKVLASISTLELTVEERHDVEVLSSQTDELLTNFFKTPEAIRSMPEVVAALEEQVKQIEQGTSSLKVSGAENFIRSLNVGTGFIKSKYNSK